MRILLALAFAGVGLAALASVPSNDLQPADIAPHAGEAMTVSGTVSDVFTDPRSQTTFIDIGGVYPFNRFAAVIFADDANRFPDMKSLSGRNVKIAGTVRLYRGTPEIVLTDANQIKAQ